MSHPLTSKERRGLAAIAAAALLLIAAGAIVRGCQHSASSLPPGGNSAIQDKRPSESASRKSKISKPSESYRKSKKASKKKTPTPVPVRDPLSEPCD